VNAQLVMAVVVVALNSGFFDGAVHTLDLAVRSRDGSVW
jgi:hypothetical protein